METFLGSLDCGTTDPKPEITCWLPKEKHLGGGVIILPGGGYGGLAEHEGRGYAEYFSAAGLACFVVTYRLGTDGARHPQMLEDAFAAILTIRSRASEFGVAANKLGIMGSSAGGHLAAHSLVAWQTYRSDVSLRPDFGVLCYPVITSAQTHAHHDSFINLLGDNPPKAMLDEVSCEKHVSKATPPCFIWHTNEDEAVPVENSVLFAAALRKHNVAHELHLYEKGVHGLGLNAPFNWAEDCVRWIRETIEAP